MEVTVPTSGTGVQCWFSHLNFDLVRVLYEI